MSLKHGLLGLLNYGPMTGYELDKAFKLSLNFFWQVQTSQIYRELRAMEQAGWLTSALEIQTDKPNKKLYSITDAGRAELLGWLSKDGGSGDTQVRSAFLMRLFFSGERSAGENIAMLRAFRAECAQGLQQLEQTGGSIAQYGETIGGHADTKTIYWGLTAQFGKAYMRMCLDFAEEAIKALEELP